jgi:hypothetical protein
MVFIAHLLSQYFDNTAIVRVAVAVPLPKYV